MASTFSLKSSSHEGRYMILSCSQTKDVAANKSTISWTLTVTGGSDVRYSTGPTTVIINGQQVYYCARQAWSINAFPTAKGSTSGTITVDHNQYGDASINVSLTTAIYVGAGSATTSSGTWTLDSIPRASQPSLSSTNFTIGDKITIYTNRASSAFTHEIFFKHADGVYYGSIASGVGDSWSWDTSHIDSECRTSMSYTADILLRTWNGGTQIGDKTISFTANVPNYDLSPVSATISLNNENSVINDWGIAVKGFTKLNWSLTPQPSQYSNYITNYYLCLIPNKDNFDADNSICDLTNTTDTSGTTDYLTYTPGTYRVKMTAKDSRDKWSNYILRDPNDSTKPLKITIYNYNTPKIQSASAFRCDSNGTATDNGTYLSIGCSGIVGASVEGRNGVSAVYQWKIVGDEYSAKASIPTDPVSGFPVTNAFEVKFTVRDTVGSEVTRIISIPLGKTDFHLTPYGAGFGAYHDSNKPDTIQSVWDLEIKGNLMADFIVEQNMNPDGWSYTKYASGKCELYGVVDTTFINGYVLEGVSFFPFQLTAVYCVVGGMRAVDNSFLDCNTTEKVTADSFKAIVYVHAVNGGFPSDSTRTVSVYVIGRYL